MNSTNQLLFVWKRKNLSTKRRNPFMRDHDHLLFNAINGAQMDFYCACQTFYSNSKSVNYFDKIGKDCVSEFDWSNAPPNRSGRTPIWEPLVDTHAQFGERISNFISCTHTGTPAAIPKRIECVFFCLEENEHENRNSKLNRNEQKKGSSPLAVCTRCTKSSLWISKNKMQ